MPIKRPVVFGAEFERIQRARHSLWTQAELDLPLWNEGGVKKASKPLSLQWYQPCHDNRWKTTSWLIYKASIRKEFFQNLIFFFHGFDRTWKIKEKSLILEWHCRPKNWLQGLLRRWLILSSPNIEHILFTNIILWLSYTKIPRKDKRILYRPFYTILCGELPGSFEGCQFLFLVIIRRKMAMLCTEWCMHCY